jgi:acyl carrier protein
MGEDVAGKTRRIIHRQLGVEEAKITLGSAFIDDLGADSLALVELTLALEDEFEIDITDEEANRIRTVRDAVMLIETRLREMGTVMRPSAS